MGLKKKKKHATGNLAQGRPPTVQRTKSISRKATRALINAHHVLEKRKSQAMAHGNTAEVATIEREVTAMGGLEKYQQASLQGQRQDRGGDSSRILMGWLESAGLSSPALGTKKLRMLEIGALSTTNECSKSGLFDIERIDLNSQGEGIRQQDFMQRPLPSGNADRFEIISLSLVLNFVPDAVGRGSMLLRTLDFLHSPIATSDPNGFFPSLFLVLPAPCVTNSRYMDEPHLEAIMASLGYDKTRSKTTQKLVYYLWTRQRPPQQNITSAKSQVRSGSLRNNFSIVLHGPPG